MLKTLGQLMDANRDAGQFYFSHDTQQFFGSVEKKFWPIDREYVLYTERSSGAPEGMPQYLAAVFTHDGREVEQARGQTLAQARSAVLELMRERRASEKG